MKFYENFLFCPLTRHVEYGLIIVMKQITLISIVNWWWPDGKDPAGNG
jgi:hypothetical protein